jgi:hypothetical protein
MELCTAGEFRIHIGGGFTDAHSLPGFLRGVQESFRGIGQQEMAPAAASGTDDIELKGFIEADRPLDMLQNSPLRRLQAQIQVHAADLGKTAPQRAGTRSFQLALFVPGGLQFIFVRAVLNAALAIVLGRHSKTSYHTRAMDKVNYCLWYLLGICHTVDDRLRLLVMPAALLFPLRRHASLRLRFQRIPAL